MTTVKELIEFLQSQPQDLRVLIDNPDCGYDDLNLDDAVIKDVFIGTNNEGNLGGQHGAASGSFVIIYNKSTNEQEVYYKYPYQEWQLIQSFADPNVFPSHGGEWAWSNGENRWVRLSPPEPVKPKSIPWPVEKALIFN